MDNRSTDLAELLDLVRGSSPQLDVPRVLTGLLQCMEAHGKKLHSMFSKWHELDATVRMNAKEGSAELNKVATSTGEVRKVLNTLLGDGFGGLAQRVDAVVDRLKKLEALQVVNQDSTSRFEALDARVKTVEKTGVDVIQDLFRLADRLDEAENGLRVVDQGTALRLEALEASLKKLENGLQVVDQGAGYRLRVEEGLKKLEALEKAVGGPVMERFLGLDGKGRPLTERVETAFQQAVEMKDLEKLLAEAQAKNQALHDAMVQAETELDILKRPPCASCGTPARYHCRDLCEDVENPCCGNYRRSP